MASANDRAGVRRSQRWDPDRYARHARFVADLGTPLLELLEAKSHERVLDLGCGDGALTEVLKTQAHSVVGVDASPEQIAAARRRGLDAHVMDGQALTFDGEFDAVLSNAAMHWMRRPEAVIDGVWRALKPGGRFIAEMGGAGNVARIKDSLVAALDRRGHDGEAHVPWYFPSVEDYRPQLERRGFEVRQIDLIRRPTPLPGSIEGWLHTFAEPFLGPLDDGEHHGFFAEIREELKPFYRDDEGNWSVDYVRLRFAAHRPDRSADRR